jgi:hypothetical protein
MRRMGRMDGAARRLLVMTPGYGMRCGLTDITGTNDVSLNDVMAAGAGCFCTGLFCWGIDSPHSCRDKAAA